MMIRFAIFCVSLFAFNITCAQTSTDQIELKGMLVDGKDRKPLSYVNIGVLNKSLGTISDTTGRFLLNLQEENLTDTLQISRIGYHKIKVVVDQFVRNMNKQIELNPCDYILEEVKVVVNKETTEVVGRTKADGFIQIAMHPKKQIVLGTEIGMRFQTE